MLAKKLIREFEVRTTLRVDIADVTRSVRRLVPDQVIEFIPSLRGDVIWGMINTWEVTKGWADEPTIIHHIHYGENLPLHYDRLVVVKEMIHVVDPPHLLTSVSADVAKLMGRIALPLDLQLTDHKEMGDRLAEFQALAILFPKAARDILRPTYGQNRLTDSEIATLAEIPEKYIAFLMSDQWDRLYSLLTTFYDLAQPLAAD